MKTKILLSTIAILFVAVLYLLYLNLQKPNQVIVQTQRPSIIPTEKLTKWVLFESKADRYSFSYPSTYSAVTKDIPKDYFVMLQGPDYKLKTTGYGAMNTGSYYYLSLNIACSPADIVGDKKIISSSNNISVYQISGYEGPDYKSAIINNNDLCFELNCNSEAGCIDQQLQEFNQILASFKFTK